MLTRQNVCVKRSLGIGDFFPLFGKLSLLPLRIFSRIIDASLSDIRILRINRYKALGQVATQLLAGGSAEQDADLF